MVESIDLEDIRLEPSVGTSTAGRPSIILQQPSRARSRRKAADSEDQAVAAAASAAGKNDGAAFRECSLQWQGLLLLFVRVCWVGWQAATPQQRQQHTLPSNCM